MAVLTAAAAPPVSFVGAKACQGCHPSEFIAQSASAHAGALSRLPDSRTFPAQAKLSRDSRYQFEILRVDKSLRVHIDDGSNIMELPLDWVFGAGRQATTFVTRVNQDWYVEHYASWYSATQAYGPTPGQDAVHPKSINEAAGILYSIADPQFGIKGCFECHATGPVTFDGNGDAHVNEAGVRCECCHGAGAEHAADPRRRKLTGPGRLSAVALNDFCGKCHRPPAAKGVTVDWNYAWNVRHQPVYLSQSQCFVKSRGALSCLTCHDPHEPATKKPAAFFNQKCERCHSGSAGLHKTESAANDRGNCIDCHMPLVSPQPPLRFANHWIGIYGNGAKLKPLR